jgi:hypothetical protein
MVISWFCIEWCSSSYPPENIVFGLQSDDMLVLMTKLVVFSVKITRRVKVRLQWWHKFVFMTKLLSPVTGYKWGDWSSVMTGLFCWHNCCLLSLDDWSSVMTGFCCWQSCCLLSLDISRMIGLQWWQACFADKIVVSCLWILDDWSSVMTSLFSDTIVVSCLWILDDYWSSVMTSLFCWHNCCLLSLDIGWLVFSDDRLVWMTKLPSDHILYHVARGPATGIACVWSGGAPRPPSLPSPYQQVECGSP